MTCDILTPPVFTVASIYLFIFFSIVVNIMGDRRTTLTSKLLETLTCLKDWKDGRMRLQTLEDELKRRLREIASQCKQ